MRWFIVVCISVAFASTLPAAEPAPKGDARQEAIRKGLAYLEEHGAGWQTSRKCAACHHVTHMVRVQMEARARGFKINETAHQEALAFLLAADNRAKILPNPGDKKPDNPNLAPLGPAYVLLAFDGKPPEAHADREALGKMVSYVIEKQDKEGFWTPPAGRPPIFDTKESATLLIALALPADQPQAAAARDKARQWLDAHPAPDQQQALALRLMLLAKLGRPATEQEAAVKALLARQNADGGWSQLKAMPSDAYASGQSLAALAAAGKFGDPAVARGRAFLFKSQQADGGWPMTSRPAKPGEKGAKNLDPISFTGTTWAMLGLLRTLPPDTSPKGK